MSSEHNDRVDRIAAELAALGEAPLSDEERPGRGEDDTVATVSTLVSLGQPLDEALVRPLSELELARVYRRVAVRLPGSVREPAATEAPANGGSRRSVWTTLTVVAAAAAFVLMPVLRKGADPLDTPEARNEARQDAAAVGEAARLGLDALGPSGSARARSLAEDYARRMNSAADGGTP